MFHNLPRKALLTFIIVIIILLGVFILMSEWLGSNDGVTVEPRIEEGPMENPEETFDEIEKPEDIQEITLPYEDGSITFHVEDVPLLNGYLKVSKAPKEELERMNLRSLDQQESIYLLEYGPIGNRKSYILMHILKDEISSILVADLTEFKEAYFSPEGTKVALLFTEDINNVQSTDKFKIIDLEKWQELVLYSGESKLKIDNKSPITSVQWISEEELTISIPNVIDPSNEEVDQGGTSSLSSPLKELPVSFEPQEIQEESPIESEFFPN